MIRRLRNTCISFCIFIILITHCKCDHKAKGFQLRKFKERGNKTFPHDSHHFAIMHACKDQTPYVKRGIVLSCVIHDDCPRNFYCQEVNDPLSGEKNYTHSVCCRSIPCNHPLKVKKQLRECTSDEDCPSDYDCRLRGKRGMVCCLTPPDSRPASDSADTSCVINSHHTVPSGYVIRDKGVCGRKCICKGGQIECKSKDDCCSDNRGKKIGQGDTYLSFDKCSECRCDQGEVKCTEIAGCKTCHVNNGKDDVTIYKRGDTYMTDNKCSICACFSKYRTICRKTGICE